jgi:hypothetical protein
VVEEYGDVHPLFDALHILHERVVVFASSSASRLSAEVLRRFCHAIDIGEHWDRSSLLRARLSPQDPIEPDMKWP